MPESALDAAVERLYAAFAPQPRPTAIEHCPCCVGRERVTEQLLAPVALRDLPVEVMADYAAHALTTVGDVADFRYFLPRILQIAVADGFNWPDLDTVVYRLPLAGWTAWAPHEQQAVREVLQALWRQTWDRYPSRPGVETVLRAVGGAEDDLTGYLDEWTAALATGQPAPAQQLRYLLTWFATSTRGRWRLMSWPRDDDRFDRWAVAGSTRAAVLAGFDAATTDEALDALAELADLL